MTTPQGGAPRAPVQTNDELARRLQHRRRQLADSLTAHLHGEGRDDEAGLPRRAAETDDDAAAETQRERDVAELTRLTAELSQVDAALARAQNGELGICVDCGESIAAARRAANPAALRCAECQEIAERRQARERRARH